MESGGQPTGPEQSSPQGAPYPGPVNSNPHLPQAKTRLTKEEINILEECNTESFWYRCVPLGLALGGAATYLVKTGHLKPHPRYGATLKTLGAGFVGYVIGKLSYQSICQQKILEKIPHSNLAQSVRKARGISSVYEEQAMGAADSQPGLKTQDRFSSMDSTTDISSRQVQELDDHFRPSLDREVKPRPDEAAADSQRTLTYDELRQRNRQEYERSMATSPNSPFRQRPFPPRSSTSSPPPPADDTSSEQSFPQPSSPSPSSSSGPRAIWDTPAPQAPGRAFDKGRGQKNQYGDVWDSN